MRVCYAHAYVHVRNTHTYVYVSALQCADTVPYDTVFKNGDQTENDVINIASIFSMDSFYCSPPSDLVENFIPTYMYYSRLYEKIDALLTSLSRQGLSFPRYRAARTKSDSPTKRIILRALPGN